MHTGEASIPKFGFDLSIRPWMHVFEGTLADNPFAGCYAMQLDTLSRSQWVVFEVRSR